MDLKSGKFACKNCTESFDGSLRCPRILPCGHTFCQLCLSNIMLQSQLCPTCKTDIPFPNVDAIPVNYLVKELVSELSAISTVSNSDHGLPLDETVTASPLKKRKKLTTAGFCDEHRYFKELKCMICNAWICSMCATLNHKDHKTLMVEEALKEMKESCMKQIANDIRPTMATNVLIGKHLKNREEHRTRLKLQLNECDMKIDQILQDKYAIEKYCDTYRQIEKLVAESNSYEEVTEAVAKFETARLLPVPTSDFVSDLPFTIKDLKLWCSEESVYVVREEAETTYYGRLDVQNDKVRLYSFQPQLPDSILIPRLIQFESFLKNLGIKLAMPYTMHGFLQFREVYGANTWETIIKTDNLWHRSRNFLQLCAGFNGTSYKGYIMRVGRWVVSMSLQSNPPAVVEEGKGWGSSEVPAKKGVVFGMPQGTSRICIFFQDCPEQKATYKFGKVVAGLEEFEMFAKSRAPLKIIDCGLIF